MTFSPEGPRSSGPGPSGYGNYGPGGQPYGSPAPGQQAQYGQQPQPSQQPQPNQQSQPGQQAQYGQGQQSYDPQPKSNSPSQLPRILSIVVAALGVVNFLLGLAGQYEAFGSTTNFFLVGNGDPTSIALLLAAGGVAAIGLLPKQPSTIGIAAALSISGWLVLVFQSFNTGESGPTGVSIGLGLGALVVLFLGFVQSAAAVVGTLFSAGVLKVPAPKPVSYGQQNPFQGYGQQNYPQSPQPGGYGGYTPQSQPQGYVPPTYTGQPSGNQNTTGSLGYPVGAPKQDSQQGGNSSYGQYQYGQPPVGSSGGYGSPLHAATSEPSESAGTSDPASQSDPSDPAAQSEHAPWSGSREAQDTPPYNAPTQAFGATPSDEDKK